MTWPATILATDGTELGPWDYHQLPAAGDAIYVGGVGYRVRARSWGHDTKTVGIVVESLTPVRTQAVK